MENYHEYITDFTLSIDENEEEFTTVELEICLKLTDRGRPAKLHGPPEDCYPAEDPEWELDNIALLIGEHLHGNKQRIILNEDACVSLFGQKFFDKHYKLAEEEANEQSCA